MAGEITFIRALEGVTPFSPFENPISTDGLRPGKTVLLFCVNNRNRVISFPAGFTHVRDYNNIAGYDLAYKTVTASEPAEYTIIYEDGNAARTFAMFEVDGFVGFDVFGELRTLSGGPPGGFDSPDITTTTANTALLFAGLTTSPSTILTSIPPYTELYTRQTTAGNSGHTLSVGLEVQDGAGNVGTRSWTTGGTVSSWSAGIAIAISITPAQVGLVVDGIADDIVITEDTADVITIINLDDVNTNEITTDAETGVTFTISDNVQDATAFKLKTTTGGFEITALNLSGTGSNYTVDMPDVAAFGIDTAGIPFSSSNWSIEYEATADARTATLAGTHNPKTGWATVDVLNGSIAKGSIFEDRPEGSPADSSQIYYDTANNTTINPQGIFSTDANTINGQLWNIDTGEWEPWNVSIVEEGLTVNCLRDALVITEDTAVFPSLSPLIFTHGFGNGVFDGTIPAVVTHGFITSDLTGGLLVNGIADNLIVNEDTAGIFKGVTIGTNEDALVITEIIAGIGAGLTVPTFKDELLITETVAGIGAGLTLNTTPDNLVITESLATIGAGLTLATFKDNVFIFEALATIGVGLTVQTFRDRLNIEETIAEIGVGRTVSTFKDVVEVIEDRAIVGAGLTIDANTDALLIQEIPANIGVGRTVGTFNDTLLINEDSSEIQQGLTLQTNNDVVQVVELKAQVGAGLLINTFKDNLIITETVAGIGAGLTLQTTHDNLVIEETVAGVGAGLTVPTFEDDLTIFEAQATIGGGLTVQTFRDRLNIEEDKATIGGGLTLNTTEDELLITESSAQIGSSRLVLTSEDELVITEGAAEIGNARVVNAIADNLLITESQAELIIGLTLQTSNDVLLITEGTAGFDKRISPSIIFDLGSDQPVYNLR